MKKLTNAFTILLMLLLAVSCSKDEGLLPVADEPSYDLKAATGIATPLKFSGMSNYEGYVPKLRTTLNAGGLPFVATLLHNEGQWYDLHMTEGFPGFERHVIYPLKISNGGVVKGYWPETWYDFMNPPELGEPNTDVIGQVSGHLGCDLHGPGISKGTINCTGSSDGSLLVIVFRFNGLDNGEESTMGPDAIWNDIEGPAVFEFSYAMEVVN